MNIKDCIGMTLKSVEQDALHRGLLFTFFRDACMYQVFAPLEEYKSPEYAQHRERVRVYQETIEKQASLIEALVHLLKKEG